MYLMSLSSVCGTAKKKKETLNIISVLALISTDQIVLLMGWCQIRIYINTDIHEPGLKLKSQSCLTKLLHDTKHLRGEKIQ